MNLLPLYARKYFQLIHQNFQHIFWWYTKTFSFEKKNGGKESLDKYANHLFLFLVPRESIPLHGRTYSGKVDTSGSSKRVFNEATLLMKTFALLLKWLKAEMHFSNGQTFKVNFWMKNSHFLDQKFGERKRGYLKYISCFSLWTKRSEF